MILHVPISNKSKKWIKTLPFRVESEMVLTESEYIIDFDKVFCSSLGASIELNKISKNAIKNLNGYLKN